MESTQTQLAHPQDQTSSKNAHDEQELSSHTSNATQTGSTSKQVEVVSDKLRDVTDVFLKFFANASNETLVACAAGLLASTYFILGRFGLLLIGVVAGIVLHATWESRYERRTDAQAGTVEGGRRRELGTEVVKRVLDWRDFSKTTLQDAVADTSRDLESTSTLGVLDFSKFPEATKAALTEFVDAVIRDYVNYWYAPMIPGETSFPASCRQVLTSFIMSISNHLSRKRPADPVLDFLANSTSILIVFLQELSTALKASPRQDPEDAVRMYLKHRPDSNLANVLSTQQQERKLNLVAEDILQNFLDPMAFALTPSRIFLREVLANLVLQQTITLCSHPDWINGWIVYLLEDGEPELMNVIDAGVEDMNDAIAEGDVDGISNQKKEHKRQLSRAEEAMQEAMLEAKRINDMIAEEEAKKRHEMGVDERLEAVSTTTANTDTGMATPTSSDSDRLRAGERSLESSMMFDSDGNIHTPATPSRSQGSFTGIEPRDASSSEDFTSQLLPTSSQATDVSNITSAILTIHNASITIYDDADPNDKSVIKAKPTSDYLIQIEPASSKFPGWMIPRKYSDFEALHETLRRIAVISGAADFTQRYSLLPAWKGRSRNSFSQDLESYLQYALQFERLAECDAMKKFIDKDRGLDKIPAQTKNVLVQSGAALENVGKGFINVLGQGGKGIAGGGKAVLGGVQGVFGAVATGVGGQKRPGLSAARTSQNFTRINLGRVDTNDFYNSQDAISTEEHAVDSNRPPPLPSRTPKSEIQDRVQSRSSSRSGLEQSIEEMNLPPPPSDILDDYVPTRVATDATPPRLPPRAASPRPSTLAFTVDEHDSVPIDEVPSAASVRCHKDLPITEEETRISIELIFAIITELYSLSSAWTIRLSLLAAAKTFLLRPNNPQLESIRVLLQESVIDANFSDSGLATHINKMRENALPTQEELKKWPPPLTSLESEKLRIKARKLLVEKGMPQALTSVMGAAASGEALGRVFDCLQVDEVARGLIFALLLQALRAATQ